MQSAPIRGSLVWIRQRRWRVESVLHEGLVTRVDVQSPSGRRTFLAPFDRIHVGGAKQRLRRVRPSHFAARLAALSARTRSSRGLQTIVDANVDVLPHQLEPALAMLAGARRILIADDVGLGKTIQAALAISEFMARDSALRALILAPASLHWQWQEELAARFGLAVRHADGPSIRDFARTTARPMEPWNLSGVWIGSLDFVKQPHVLEAACSSVWDMVVIDEAHTACGDSDRHGAASALASRARKVVLLTATPHSGDAIGFRRLTGLGELAIDTAGADELRTFRRTRVELGLQGTRNVRWLFIDPSMAERALLDAVTAFERAVLSGPSATRDASVLLLSVLRKRCLSTPAALLVSLHRRLAWVESRDSNEPSWSQPVLTFDDDGLSRSEETSLTSEIGLRRDREREWLQRLLALCRRALAADSKLECVAALLRRTNEPVVIFTEFRDSLAAIATSLGSVRRVSAVHGGLTVEELGAQIRQFTSGQSSVLAATDVAAQGLNLQRSCRWVVNFDLPWSPARLEQRAGRVDRLGQRRKVHVSLLLSRHAAEFPVIARMTRRVLLARQALGADAFEDFVPDETTLRQSVAAPHIALCRRWQRPAVALARLIDRRRKLAGRFRSTAAIARPLWTPLDRLNVRRVFGLDDLLFFFLVPIVDGSGATVEERLIGVRASGSRRTSTVTVRLEQALQVANQMALPRARRIAILRREMLDRELTLERRLAEVAAAEFERRQCQPGLFDRRAILEAGKRSDAVREIRNDLAAAIRRHERACSIAVGEPSLVLVSGRRRP
jgi:superfamily II DNA or RNA helicase